METIGFILLVAVAVAIAPVVGAVLLGAVCIVGLALMYLLAVILELANGKSIKEALR